MSTGTWWVIGIVVVIAVVVLIFGATGELTTIKFKNSYISFIIHNEVEERRHIFFKLP